MSHYWLLVSFSWFGSVSLQYINTGGPGDDSILDPMDLSLRYPLPYMNHFNLPISHSPLESYQNGATNSDNYNDFINPETMEQTSGLQRKRRTIDDVKEQDTNWVPNLLDSDKTTYLQNDDKFMSSPFIVQGFSGSIEPNATDLNINIPEEKKSFSPWGGKRTSPSIEHMWTWKRAANVREPSMPKRVRFSPWGGKRSGQLIYKPSSNKGSKIIFSATMPEVTRVISNYSPNGKGFNLAGFQFMPTLDSRHPFRFLALSTNIEKQTRDALPFNAFLDALPKMYKPGHPYVDINLKKDGKRKVKFSAWGGKRSPPIIGPIWTPPSQNNKDTSLDAILLIKNSQGFEDKASKAF